MRNNTTTINKTQPFSSRLANLPKLADIPRTPTTKPTTSVEPTELSNNFGKPSNVYCAVCEKLIPHTEKLLSISVRVCSECLAIYAKIENALNDAADRRYQEKQLERFAEKLNRGAK